ncbi:MAG: hypothetical protein PVI78_08245 [Anaerolineales bacterium]|jgi:Flp pilus assembly pilin Flp
MVGIGRSPLPLQKGQGLAEYQLILSIVVVVLVAALGLIGGKLADIYQSVVDSLLQIYTEPGATAEELENACIDQDLIPDRRTGSYCSESGDCDRLKRGWFEDIDTGTYTAGEPIEVLIVKTGSSFHTLTPSSPGDGCISAEFDGNSVSWEKTDLHDSSCKNIQHVQVWRNPLCP